MVEDEDRVVVVVGGGGGGVVDVVDLEVVVVDGVVLMVLVVWGVVWTGSEDVVLEAVLFLLSFCNRFFVFCWNLFHQDRVVWWLAWCLV